MGTAKQIIVINMEANMPLGRLVAQAAHASYIAVLHQGEWIENNKFVLDTTNDKPFEDWLKNSFTKIVCKTWGKQSLLDIKEEADKLGLKTGLMEEDGELTALAIGPEPNEALRHFGYLKLL